MRLDLFIKNKYGYSREYSKNLIESGKVAVNGIKKNIKPSFKVTDNDEITLAEGTELKYVGRGGYKLEKALEVFDIDLKGKRCIDVGASTGGFTDCMLQNGAELVYSVDVGSNQLAEKLKSDKRVISFEKTNINNFELNEKIDFISVDVSFVSLSIVINSIYNLLKDNGEIVFLVKPQFEAGKENIGKNGIVKKPKVHKVVLRNVIKFTNDVGFSVKNVTLSPIKGGDGNIEYLLYAVKNADLSQEIDIDKLIKVAFEQTKEE